jgi:hypothetical protein
MEQFDIKDSKGNTEYHVTVEESDKSGHIHYSMFTSDSKIWSKSARNSLLMKITNTGNGIKIKKMKNKSFNFGYDEAFYLYVLLNTETNRSITSRRIQIPEKISVLGQNSIKK